MNSVENSTTIDIGGENIDYDVSIITGWNLVGLSVNMEWPGQLSVFPTSVEETLYGYSESYFLTDALVPGAGYWLRFDEKIYVLYLTGCFEAGRLFYVGWLDH